MIDDILDLTRIELKSFSLSKSWFDLKETIKDISDILAQQISFKNLEYIVDISENVPK